MAERGNEQKNFFKNLHTDQYKWNDFFLIPLIVTIVMMFVGQTGVLVISKILMKPIINDNNVDFLTIFQQYFTFLGVWIIALLYCYFTQKNRPIIKALTPFCKGNTVKYLLLGLLIGFAQNAFCIMVALLHKDIHIYFDSLNLLQVIPLFIVVFIQSSAEELLCNLLFLVSFLLDFSIHLWFIIAIQYGCLWQHTQPGISPRTLYLDFQTVVTYRRFQSLN